ncbi:alpha/beta hydrolase [Halobacillus seohaensis]|uniref:Alpha/beta hydrolase n=1 Tax=Halobacillus seohaensis TaxID=447421 RepID=A0ABW2EL11_9BACI
MVLDPQAKVLLVQMEAAGSPPLESLPPAEARQAFRALEGSSNEHLESVAKIESQRIPGPNGDIQIRVYTPEGEGPHPAFVFFHGGGWVIGDLDTHDNICRSLTNLANCVVVSVDYRLAPEHKFPIPIEDCYAASQWVFEHPSELNIDADKIAVGGDSAGGNLAAVVTHLAKERGTPKLSYQLLFYPSTDFTRETESMQDNAEGYFLTKDSMIYFRNHYLKNQEDARNLLASPLLVEDLSELPPAMVVTAEYDPLRDEGEAYANRLQGAGVPVILKRFEGMIHGFVSMADKLDKGKEALQFAADSLRNGFEKVK